MAAVSPVLRAPGLAFGPNRAVVLDPAAAAGREAEVAASGVARVEDGFSVLDLAPHGFAVAFENTVMARAPGPAGAPPAGIAPVADADGLARAEATLIEAFWRTWRPGEILPPGARDTPGWTTWISEDGGGTVTSFDDGRTLGIYWLGVLEAARSRGLGRALMTAALAGRAVARPVVLSSTVQGRPLYASLGFEALGTATWWARQ